VRGLPGVVRPGVLEPKTGVLEPSPGEELKEELAPVLRISGGERSCESVAESAFFCGIDIGSDISKIVLWYICGSGCDKRLKKAAPLTTITSAMFTTRHNAYQKLAPDKNEGS
jgi:hypothetical protein